MLPPSTTTGTKLYPLSPTSGRAGTRKEIEGENRTYRANRLEAVEPSLRACTSDAG